MYIPQDNYMLLSIINMKLRDSYSSLDSLCDSEDISKEEIITKLKSIGYNYNKDLNQFMYLF